jgi:phosphatidylglycerophosphatase A
MGESLLPLWGRIGILLLVFGLTWHAFRKVGPLYVTDPPWIVADEIVALLLLAGLYPLHSAQEIGIAFVAFRFWDIAKLWPANEAEKLPGLWGILADDAVAAGYTLLCLWLLA